MYSRQSLLADRRSVGDLLYWIFQSSVIVAGNTSLCTYTNESDRHATTYGFYERSPLRSLNARIYHARVRQFE